MRLRARCICLCQRGFRRPCGGCGEARVLFWPIRTTDTTRSSTFQGDVRYLQRPCQDCAPAATIGKLDGVACHRTLHLMNKDGAFEFARCAAALVRPGGSISLGARSPRDFHPEAMEWVQGQEGQTARYKDSSRTGQLLTFLDEPSPASGAGTLFYGSVFGRYRAGKIRQRRHDKADLHDGSQKV